MALDLGKDNLANSTRTAKLGGTGIYFGLPQLQERKFRMRSHRPPLRKGREEITMGREKSRTSHATPVTLEGTTERFIQTLVGAGGPAIHKMSTADARKVLDSLQSQPIEKLPAHIEDKTIAAGPTGEISLRIVRPEKSSGILPVIMYFHGGGGILGNANTHDRLVRELANGARAAVVLVNYAPSPEAKYPTAIEQAYAAAKYIAERRDTESRSHPSGGGGRQRRRKHGSRRDAPGQGP
jgi:alpha/beta hydrolase fold